MYYNLHIHNQHTHILTPQIKNDKINIFHGINSHSSIKKGNKFFTEALFIIKKKYSAHVQN